MTRLNEMDAGEIRVELEYWRELLEMYAREYRVAVMSGEGTWEHGIGIALDQALDQVRRRKRLLKLGIAT